MSINTFRRARVAIPVASFLIAAVLIALVGNMLLQREHDASAVGLGEPDATFTLDDYEAAVQATIQCLEQGGVEAKVLPGRGLRPTAFGVRLRDQGGGRDETIARLQKIDSTCRELHLSAADQELMELRDQPTAEEANAIFDRLEACIADGGPESPESDNGAGVVTTMYPQAGGRQLTISNAEGKAFFACALAEQAYSGWHAPSPTFAE